MSLILASASAIRRHLLEQAGVAHEVEPARIDESPIKRSHDGNDEELALALAEAKALEVSGRLSGNWVIGADSVVSVNGRRFGKPGDREEAARHLSAFSGNTIVLTSAVVIARDGHIDWRLADHANLQVRPLSERFIHNYLEMEWPAVAACVGVFRMEGPGIQLFDRIDGDHFTILGMPLLPLLNALRERQVLPS
ncbi:septum formation protein Maf [Sphingomonas sp. HDW15A]|uniref:Maf family protein n=1 Tax=Sphingomonas sp. HDW15A TaxID=2714942 RepID=UPI00140AE9A0|nr:Maf family protein [Sphingomonas sp. HDW15A]QIK96967.1 septum formation protein Maf [Sphingomonas sp. HDW15A]